MPKLFNVAVHSVVLHCQSLTMEDEYAIHDGIGMSVGRSMGVFYEDGGLIISRDLEWFQGASMYLFGLF